MPIDANIYGNIKPFEAPSVADSAGKAMNLSSLMMQQKRAQQQIGQEDQQAKVHAHLQKASIFGNALESLSGLPEEQRAMAYPKARMELVSAGVLKPEDAPEQYDPGFYRQSLMKFQQSKEGIEKRLSVAKLANLQSETNKNNADAGMKGGRAGILGKLTEGQKAVDKDYAKSYNALTQKGAVNAKTAIDRLERLAGEIESDTGFGEAGGGRIASMLPDSMRSRDAIRRRDQAKNFANTTLKELFGGQLSDAEREAAAKEYYNDALGNEDNAKIIREKIAQLRDAYSTEVAKANYYEQNGTLLGFRGVPQGAGQSGDRQTAQNNRGASGSFGMKSANASDLSTQDMEALHWAQKNGNDPRAQQILKMHGVK